MSQLGATMGQMSVLSEMVARRKFASAPAGSPLFNPPFLSGPRNNSDNWLGAGFTVGGADIVVTALGRWIIATTAQSHAVRLVRVSDSAILAEATVAPSGLTMDYAYTALGSPVTLAAGQSYYVASKEFNGGDEWNDYALFILTTVTPADATETGGAYSADGVTWNLNAVPSLAFGPPNLLYHL